MTKKHFIYMARRIKEVEDKKTKEALIAFCVQLSTEFNPNFDKDRFIFACESLTQEI